MADADNDIHDLTSCDAEARTARTAAETLLNAMDDGHFDLDLAAIDRLNALPMGLVLGRP